MIGRVEDIAGLDLAESYFVECVEPIVAESFPELRYSAGRLGRGSEVLGFDDVTSRDHDWGPRVDFFVADDEGEPVRRALDDLLAAGLPRRFRGYSTSFGFDADGVGVMVDVDEAAPVAHRIEVHAIGAWLDEMLAFDPRRPMRDFDWLATSSHRLAEMTGGRVFRDDLGVLDPIRSQLAYYPDEVWLFVLASQWKRIAQEEAFVGRCSEQGDHLGAAVVTARLVRDLMRLSLMMARQYVPYTKWLGRAFERLSVAPALSPLLESAAQASDPDDREALLGAAYEIVAAEQNRLGVARHVEPTVRSFWRRGYQVILADRFVVALLEALHDSPLARQPLVGSVDQFVDSTDVLAVAVRARAAAAGVYGELGAPTAGCGAGSTRVEERPAPRSAGR